jgi:hypothetical protein
MPSLFTSFPQVRPFGLENGQKKGRESFAAQKSIKDRASLPAALS